MDTQDFVGGWLEPEHLRGPPCTPAAMLFDSIVRIEFIWYWLDENGKWIEYGKKHSEHRAATVSSPDLESAFLADSKGVVFFQAGTQLYELNFQEMVQRNLHYQTQRKVCRWPRLVFFGGGRESKKRYIMNFSPNCTCCVFSLVLLSAVFSGLMPSWWRSPVLLKSIRTSRNYSRRQWKVILSKDSEGFRTLLSGKSSSGRQREQMKKWNGGKDIEEKLLFHGTSASHLHHICGQNFDWRICGTHGTLYGKGSYFARDASYSHTYCRSDTRIKIMFVARVLVGDYVQGKAAYLRPPSRPNQSNRFYDSCVDCLWNPSIFVIFEKYQIYPAYIIEYEQETNCVVM
ncbi:Protein mono-ADP-ribosyltransferase PARP12 [Varanus komodoensis]|nr:Protein mono-ADP-ribosyltransferase PARP12 [Varanus komodoensis]